MPIEEWIPTPEVTERHEIEVDAPAASTYAVVRNLDLSHSPAALLFKIRGVTHALRGEVPFSRRLTLDLLRDLGFVTLQEEPGHEIVLGAVGKFWRIDSGIVRIAAEDFIPFDKPGFAKGVLAFAVEPLGESRCRVLTETRVSCTDESARRRFLLYWRAIGPFSALIRRWMLDQVKSESETAPQPIRR